MKKNKTTVNAILLPDLKTAREVFTILHRQGIEADDINLLLSNQIYRGERPTANNGFFVENGEAKIKESAETGAVIGSAGGFIVGLTALTVPGIGPLLLAGSVLMTTLTGGVVGGVAGGLFGIMMDFGVPENQARTLVKGVEEGKVMLFVETNKLSKNDLERALAEKADYILQTRS